MVTKTYTSSKLRKWGGKEGGKSGGGGETDPQHHEGMFLLGCRVHGHSVILGGGGGLGRGEKKKRGGGFNQVVLCAGAGQNGFRRN